MEYSQECEIYSWIVSLPLKEKKKYLLGIVSVPPSVPGEACDAGELLRRPPSSSGGDGGGGGGDCWVCWIFLTQKTVEPVGGAKNHLRWKLVELPVCQLRQDAFYWCI